MAQNNKKKAVVGVYNVGDLAGPNCPPPIPPQPAGVVRIVCMSDTHQQEKKFSSHIPPGDIFLYAGDFTYTGAPDAISSFAKWLKALPHPTKVVIAGNHDVTLDPSYYEKHFKRLARIDISKELEELKSSCILLEDSEITTPQGIRIYGSPRSIEFCDWAFPLAQNELLPCWQKIPSDGIDIVMTHGPCHHNHGGKTVDGFDAGDNVLLQELISRVHPLVHVSGHIHEGYGVSNEAGITFVNTSSVNFNYRPVNSPIVIDISV